jgi:serine/threonine protein kinase
MKTKAVWYPPQQAPDPELDVFMTEHGDDVDRSGKILGKRYKLIRRIGSGATASVYEAKDTITGAQVAVKILHPQLHAALRAFFGQEGRIAARHDCPHLVQATDFGETRGVAYTVFSFVRGKPLRWLAGVDAPVSSTPLPWRRLCRIILQVLEALAVLHKRGVVHRDLHSGNILVDESRDDFTVVIDVGFAAVMPPRRITMAPEPTRTVYGMYGYVAPEARAGCPPDPRMDLYAVGVMMFELLTGLEIIDYARNLGKLAVPPLRVLAPGLDIPEAIDAIVLRALSDVSIRYASADEMAAAIRAALAESETAPSARRDALRPTMIASLGAACAVVGGLVVGGMLAARPATPTLAAMTASSEPAVGALNLRQPEPAGPLDHPLELRRAPPGAPADGADTADTTDLLCAAPSGELAPDNARAHSPARARPEVAAVQTHVAADRSRPPLTSDQRLIRKARRSILDCKPAGALSKAAVVIERRPGGAVTVRFNGHALQGHFGRCVADFATTAALGPDGRLEFTL